MVEGREGLRPDGRVRKAAKVFIGVYLASAFVIWTIWAALAVGHAGAANARTAAALCIAALLLATVAGVCAAVEDQL